MSKRLRIGIAGLGDHAMQSHVLPLQELENAQIAAAFDPQEGARQRFRCTGFEGPIYDDLTALAADPEVDAVIVCSPDKFHADALSHCVDSGKHVLVEKPLADSHVGLRSVRASLATASRAGLVVSSCHPRRFDPPYLWLKANLQRFTEQLGEPRQAYFDFFYHRPSKVGLHTGLLSDHMNHEVDTLHYLFGHDGFVAHRLLDSETRYEAAGIRNDDLSFVFRGSRSLDRRAFIDVITIQFEWGFVEVNTETGHASIVDYEANSKIIEECGATDYDLRFRGVNANFVDAALGKRACYLTAEDLMVNTEAGIYLTRGRVFRYHGPPGPSLAP